MYNTHYSIFLLWHLLNLLFINIVQCQLPPNNVCRTSLYTSLNTEIVTTQNNELTVIDTADDITYSMDIKISNFPLSQQWFNIFRCGTEYDEIRQPAIFLLGGSSETNGFYISYSTTSIWHNDMWTEHPLALNTWYNLEIIISQTRIIVNVNGNNYINNINFESHPLKLNQKCYGSGPTFPAGIITIKNIFIYKNEPCIVPLCRNLLFNSGNAVITPINSNQLTVIDIGDYITYSMDIKISTFPGYNEWVNIFHCGRDSDKIRQPAIFLLGGSSDIDGFFISYSTTDDWLKSVWSGHPIILNIWYSLEIIISQTTLIINVNGNNYVTDNVWGIHALQSNIACYASDILFNAAHGTLQHILIYDNKPCECTKTIYNSLSSSFNLLSNNELTRIDIVNDLIFSMSLTIHSFPAANQWVNIFHCGSTDMIRQPAIYIFDQNQNEVGTGFMISYSTIYNVYESRWSGEILELNKQYNIKIVITQNIFKIYINGNLIIEENNYNPHFLYKNEPCYASGPWWSVADVTIKNILIENIEECQCELTDSESIESDIYNSGNNVVINPQINNLLTTINIIDNMYYSMDITINSFPPSGQWVNIFYCGENGDIFQPAIFIWGGSEYKGFYISYSTMFNSNPYIESLNNLELNKKYHLEIIITQNIYKININGITIINDNNYYPHNNNLQQPCYASTPHLAHAIAADVNIENIIIKQLPFKYQSKQCILNIDTPNLIGSITDINPDGTFNTNTGSLNEIFCGADNDKPLWAAILSLHQDTISALNDIREIDEITQIFEYIQCSEIIYYIIINSRGPKGSHIIVSFNEILNILKQIPGVNNIIESSINNINNFISSLLDNLTPNNIGFTWKQYYNDNGANHNNLVNPFDAIKEFAKWLSSLVCDELIGCTLNEILENIYDSQQFKDAKQSFNDKIYSFLNDNNNIFFNDNLKNELLNNDFYKEFSFSVTVGMNGCFIKGLKACITRSHSISSNLKTNINQYFIFESRSQFLEIPSSNVGIEISGFVYFDFLSKYDEIIFNNDLLLNVGLMIQTPASSQIENLLEIWNTYSDKLGNVIPFIPNAQTIGDKIEFINAQIQENQLLFDILTGGMNAKLSVLFGINNNNNNISPINCNGFRIQLNLGSFDALKMSIFFGFQYIKQGTNTIQLNHDWINNAHSNNLNIIKDIMFDIATKQFKIDILKQMADKLTNIVQDITNDMIDDTKQNIEDALNIAVDGVNSIIHSVNLQINNINVFIGSANNGINGAVGTVNNVKTSCHSTLNQGKEFGQTVGPFYLGGTIYVNQIIPNVDAVCNAFDPVKIAIDSIPPVPNVPHIPYIPGVDIAAHTNPKENSIVDQEEEEEEEEHQNDDKSNVNHHIFHYNDIQLIIPPQLYMVFIVYTIIVSIIMFTFGLCCCKLYIKQKYYHKNNNN